jgi:hypothetical protein
MYCPNCASQIHSNVKFCTRCGANLTAISDLLNGAILEPPQSAEITRLLEKCHNGYLSTVIGLGLVIIALSITVTAMMFDVIPAAISGLLFLGWAIPAIAQGAGKWLSAKSEIRSILKVRSGDNSDVPPHELLPSDAAVIDSRRFAGSVTEGTTAGLNPAQ